MILASLVVAVAGGADVAPYQGKYAKDASFRKSLAEIPGLWDRAIPDIEKRLGLTLSKTAPIRIEVIDARPEPFEAVKRFTEPAFSTRGSGDTDGDPIVVRLHAEFMVNGVQDWRTSLKHELVHAVMRASMSDAAHDALPSWLREGLALWVAGQTDDRLASIQREKRAFADPTALFPGLESGQHDLNRYAEDALAIEKLATDHGPDAPGRLVRLLVEGKEAHAAIAQIAGGSFESFRDACRAHGIERAKAAAPEGWEDFVVIAEADTKAARAAVRAKAPGFLEKRPDSPLVPDVLYWLGKSCRIDGDCDDARPPLEKLVKKHALGADYVDEALYQLASADIEQKKFASALARLESHVRDHPDGGSLDRVVERAAFCHAELKNEKEALRWIAIFERSFPKSQYADEVATLKAKLAAK